jgi:hypothetical protein
MQGLIHPGLEALLTTGQKPHCLLPMHWRVLKLFLKCQEKPASHLVDEAVKMGAKIVSVDLD